MSNTEYTYIYALCQPNTNEVRYVGKSDNPRVRLYNHIRRQDGPDGRGVVEWIQSLMDLGTPPRMVILERVPYEGWELSERRWIRRLLELGARLTNGWIACSSNPGVVLEDLPPEWISGDLGDFNFSSRWLSVRDLTSQYRGVYFALDRNKWRAAIRPEPKTLINIGTFDDEEQAAKEYDKMAVKLFGPNAELNFPNEPGLGDIIYEPGWRPEERLPTSEYYGVSQLPGSSKWRANISWDQGNSRQLYIGNFGIEEDAARAVDQAAKKLHENWGKFNFPDDPELTMIEYDPNWRPERIRPKTRFVGAVYIKKRGNWGARIRVNGKLISGGSFDTDIQAAHRYNELAKEFFGDNAKLNHLTEEELAEVERLNDLPKFKDTTKYSSKYRGVSFAKNCNKWMAYVDHGGKRHNLGLFTSELDAAHAYNARSLELLGDQAKLNDIE